VTAPDWFNQAIAKTPERATVDVKGCAIEALAWGERGKPGLLLIHGAGAHADWWAHIAPILAEDFRVAALSLSGMGRSGHRAAYSIPLYAEEALAVAEWAGLFQAGPPVIAGHSFGGRVSLRCAASERAGELRACLTLDTLISPPDLKIGSRPFGDKVRTYPTLEAALERFRLIPPQPCENGFIVDYIAPRSLKRVEDGWTWCFDHRLWDKLEDWRTVEDLKAAKAPVGLVWGERSKLMAPVITDYIRANAPAKTPIVILPEAHHHLMLDQPLALISALRGLLAGWPPKDVR
jgi:pimeloyl-ACP methyl ester carboxylesterase